MHHDGYAWVAVCSLLNLLPGFCCSNSILRLCFPKDCFRRRLGHACQSELGGGAGTAGEHHSHSQYQVLCRRAPLRPVKMNSLHKLSEGFGIDMKELHNACA